MLLSAKRSFAYWAVPLALLLASCSSAPFRSEPLDRLDVVDRAQSQERGAFRVRASVPGPEETYRLFGLDLYDRDIQPVWLEVSNRDDRRARLVLTSIDPKYFSPHEVAYIHRKKLSREGWQDLEAWLHENALPRQIAPGETVSGFVFTNESRGTKAFNVDVFHAGAGNRYERFTFFLAVPGFVPDHAAVDFQALYAADSIEDVDKDGFRVLLDGYPWCTTDRSGTRRGRPVDTFFVGEDRELLSALLRAGWSETSYARDDDYLDRAQHYLGRAPDAVFRKGRDRTTERLELSLWLAPVRVDGKPLWAGQLRHAVGRLFELGERFFGVTLDPDAREGRNYILQDIWYAQALRHWAWSDADGAVPQDAPVADFNGNPWFHPDGLRIALWISGEPIALSEATPIDWPRIDRLLGDDQ